jgi:hypothetical protein
VNALPTWEQGTPGILCVAGPHAIPVSTAVRIADDRLVFALGSRRETLARLRRDPGVALCLLGAGVAFTAHGSGAVIRERLEASDSVVAVELKVERVQDHLADGRTDMVDGARWRWTDDDWAETERAIVQELRSLSAG